MAEEIKKKPFVKNEEKEVVHGSQTLDEQVARMRDAGYEAWEIEDELDERATMERLQAQTTKEMKADTPRSIFVDTPEASQNAMRQTAFKKAEKDFVERGHSMTEEKKQYGFLNVHDWQVKGERINPETGGTISASLRDADCQPKVNSQTGNKFYNVLMPEGAEIERNGETIDLSGLSTTVGESFIHKSKFGDYYGCLFDSQKELTFKRGSYNEAGQFEVEKSVNVTLEEAFQAQKAAQSHYAEKMQNRSQPAPKIEQKREVKQETLQEKAAQAKDVARDQSQKIEAPSKNLER